MVIRLLGASLLGLGMMLLLLILSQPSPCQGEDLVLPKPVRMLNDAFANDIDQEHVAEANLNGNAWHSQCHCQTATVRAPGPA